MDADAETPELADYAKTFPGKSHRDVTAEEHLPKDEYRAIRNQFHAIQREESEWPARSELATAVRVDVLQRLTGEDRGRS